MMVHKDEGLKFLINLPNGSITLSKSIGGEVFPGFNKKTKPEQTIFLRKEQAFNSYSRLVRIFFFHQKVITRLQNLLRARWEKNWNEFKSVKYLSVANL